MKLPMSVPASAIGQVLGLPLSPTHASMGGGTPAWTPALWFLASEQGIWLAPGDFTRYIGKKGPELITNGDFSGGATGWTLGSTWAISGGVATVNNPGSFSALGSNAALVIGKWYEMTFTVVSISAGSIAVRMGAGGFGSTVTAAGTYTSRLRCAISASAYLHATAGTIATVDNISLRELPAIPTATLFQDSVGTTPDTGVEQPNGLLLDKRLGLERGAERVSDPDLNNAGAWSPTGSIVVSGGVATYTSASIGNACKPLATTVTEVGKWYEMEIVVDSITSGVLSCGAGQGNTPIKSGLVVGLNRVILPFTGSVGTPTVYAGTAGTTAVVSRISVKELPGNHVLQSTAAARPVLSARVNNLSISENFAEWGSVGAAAVLDNAVLAPDGKSKASKLQAIAGTGGHFIRNASIGAGVNLPTCRSLYVKRGTARYIWISAYTNATPTQPVIACFDFDSGNFTNVGGEPTNSAQVIDAGDGWYRITYYRSNEANVYNQFGIGFTDPTNSAVNEYNSDGTQTAFIWAAQHEVGMTATKYQRVNTATDYDTVGFPHYLMFDGVDDGLGTTFLAGTLGSSMDCFMLVRRDATTQAALMYGQSASEVAALVVSDDGAAAYGNAGTPTYAVNGAAVTATRGALHTALPVGKWYVLEIRNLNLSTWTALRFGDLVNNKLKGTIAEVILAPAQSAEERTKVRGYLAAKAGIILT